MALPGIPAKPAAQDWTATWNWLAAVQAAVNANITDIGTLKTDDASTQSAVSALQTSVGSNTSAITTLQGQVGTNTTDVSTLKSQVATLQTDDTATQAAIGTANSNISTLQGQVATLQTDDASTKSAISGLQTSVGTNTTDITTLKGQVSTLQTDDASSKTAVSALQTSVGTNTSDIATLKPQVAQNTSDIAALKSASPTGSNSDEVVVATGASEATLRSALGSGKPVYIEAGTYTFTPPLNAPGDTVQVRGAGAGSTVLVANTAAADYLVVGSGNGNQVRPTGWLKDLTVRGPSAAPVSGKAAVVINGLNQFAVENVQADNADIGFDLRNNCYGTGFRNIRAGFGSSCNVGVYLRTGPQSGSDLTFNNPWVAGKIAAFHVAGNGGGFHVFGGQVGAGQGTAGAVDTSAAFCLGKDYLTGALGTTDIDLHGVSFEGTNNAWCFRAFDQVRVVVDGCAFNPVDQAHLAIGLFKSDNYKNSRVLLTGNIVSGFWSGPKLVSITNDWGGDFWWEVGTYTAAQAPTIAGTSTFVDSFIAQSGRDGNAVVVDRLGIEFGGLKLRNNAGVLEQSVDGGTTWTPVSTGSTGGGTPPPATGGTVAIAPSPTFPGVYAVTLSA